MRKIVTRTYLDTPDPWSKPELQIRERESKRAQNLSARDLVLCFPLCVSDTSDWKNYFPVLYPASFNCFQRKKIRVTAAISCVWMTHVSKKTSWWFLMSWKSKVDLRSRSPEDDLSSNELPIRGTTTNADYDQTKLVHFVFPFQTTWALMGIFLLFLLLVIHLHVHKTTFERNYPPV